MRPILLILAISSLTLIGCEPTPSKTPTPSTQASLESLTEAQKIERLIVKVESMTGAVFVRNGVEHSPKDASKHLRDKLEATAGGIKTASQFIDAIASKSSITGEEYEIRYSDGRTETTASFLHDELAKLEQRR